MSETHQFCNFFFLACVVLLFRFSLGGHKLLMDEFRQIPPWLN